MTLPGAHLQWEDGGEARVESLVGESIVLVSTVSAPPGSRPVGVLLLEPRARVRFKVHGCRALGDGTFRVEGRGIDWTREVRGRIEGLG